MSPFSRFLSGLQRYEKLLFIGSCYFNFVIMQAGAIVNMAKVWNFFPTGVGIASEFLATSVWPWFGLSRTLVALTKRRLD